MKYKKFVYGSLIILLLVGLVYVSLFFMNHKKYEYFYSEYNLMNEDYKIVLFATGQEQNDSSILFTSYNSSWNNFYNHNRINTISPFNEDPIWQNSLDEINSNIIDANNLIKSKELHNAHLKLENVRGVWQDIFERNNVSMIGFYLTEFHDVMEKAVEGSENPDFDELSLICLKLNDKWSYVEKVKMDLSDDKLIDYNSKKKIEKNNINNYCDAVSLKEDSKLVDLSSKLKKDFVSIYLIYG